LPPLREPLPPGLGQDKEAHPRPSHQGGADGALPLPGLPPLLPPLPRGGWTGGTRASARPPSLPSCGPWASPPTPILLQRLAVKLSAMTVWRDVLLLLWQVKEELGQRRVRCLE
jgi:hypothetical protein